MSTAARVREKRRLRREAIIATLGPCVICGGPIPFGKPGVNLRSVTCGGKCAARRANEKQWARDKRKTYDRRRYWKATGRGHTYRKHRIDTRPAECRNCGTAITQPRVSRKYFCSARCRSEYFRVTHPGYRAVTPVEPMPMAYVGHEVFEAARVAAGIRVDYQSDWGQNDILGEAVLAILEGRDPNKAIAKVRGDMKVQERLRAWKVIDFGADPDGNIITVREYEGD